MKPGGRLYRVAYCIVRVVFGIVYRFEVTGRERIPEGAALVCASHSKAFDPFYLAFAFTRKYRLYIMAKIELFRIPVLAPILRKLGMIGVDRGISDVSAIRATLNCLKGGGLVGIFPEGTRVSEDEAGASKRGAVWLAERAGVPLLPVYIPRRMSIFRRNPLVIGEPYVIEKIPGKRPTEGYTELADDLMSRIAALKPQPKSK